MEENTKMEEGIKRRLGKIEERENSNKPNYVAWDYCTVGKTTSMLRDEVNETIEEIISILREKCITVQVAKQILEDTISSIEECAVLDKML